MKNCLALRHVAFETAGILEPILDKRGCQIRYLDIGIDELDSRAIQDVDLLIVLGGPVGVYDDQAYPFLTDEIGAIGARIGRQKPSLGICLGAQLMAKALGASVAPGPVKEIGWAPVELTAMGNKSALRHISGLPVLHWHGDNFTLPQNCESLASTAHC